MDVMGSISETAEEEAGLGAAKTARPARPASLWCFRASGYAIINAIYEMIGVIY